MLWERQACLNEGLAHTNSISTEGTPLVSCACGCVQTARLQAACPLRYGASLSEAAENWDTGS